MPVRSEEAHLFPTLQCSAGRVARYKMIGVDDDLLLMTRKELAEEVRKLRSAIRAHKDVSRNDLGCHHFELWSLLPEEIEEHEHVA